MDTGEENNPNSDIPTTTVDCVAHMRCTHRCFSKPLCRRESFVLHVHVRFAWLLLYDVHSHHICTITSYVAYVLLDLEAARERPMLTQAVRGGNLESYLCANSPWPGPAAAGASICHRPSPWISGPLHVPDELSGGPLYTFVQSNDWARF